MNEKYPDDRTPEQIWEDYQNESTWPEEEEECFEDVRDEPSAVMPQKVITLSEWEYLFNSDSPLDYASVSVRSVLAHDPHSGDLVIRSKLVCGCIMVDFYSHDAEGGDWTGARACPVDGCHGSAHDLPGHSIVDLCSVHAGRVAIK